MKWKYLLIIVVSLILTFILIIWLNNRPEKLTEPVTTPAKHQFAYKINILLQVFGCNLPYFDGLLRATLAALRRLPERNKA